MKLILLLILSLSSPIYSQSLLHTLELDVPLFGFQNIAFDSSSHLAVQQEYLFKQLREHPGQYGLLLSNLQNYYSQYSAHETRDRTDSLFFMASNYKLKNLPKQDQLVIQAFFILEPSKTQELDSAWIRRFLRESSDSQNSSWVRLLSAMSQVYLSESKKFSESVTPVAETILNEISIRPPSDPMFHFALGNFYHWYLKDANPYRRLRMVTMELERSRASDPRNRNLFTRITSKYIQLQQEFENKDIPQPFEFEELVYRRIIMLDPKNAWAYNNLAYLYCQNNVEHKEALRHARIANELEVNNPYLMDTLGWCLYRNQDLDSALEILEKARGLNPDLADVHFHLATIYYDLGRKDDSILAFRKCIEVDPENYLAMNNLAYTYAEENRNLEEALELSLKSLQYNPENSAFLDTLGWIYYRLNRFQLAEENLKKALALSPDAEETHLHLAEVYKKTHQPDLETEHRMIAQKLRGDTTTLISSSPQEGAGFHPAHAVPDSSQDLAYRLLFGTIVEARNRYLRDPNTNKDATVVKLFYDQLISLAQNKGDSTLVQRLAMEFDAYRRAQPALATSAPAENQTPLVPFDGNVLSLFSKNSLAFVKISQSDLQLLLTQILKTDSVQHNLPKEHFVSLVDRYMPEQLALGISPDINVTVALIIQPEQMSVLRDNLELLQGNSVTAPYTAQMVTFQKIRDDAWLLRSSGYNIWLGLRENLLVLSSSDDSLSPVPADQSLMTVNALNQTGTLFYSKNLSKLLEGVLNSSLLLPLFSKYIKDSTMLNLVGEYVAHLNFEANSLTEKEHFFAQNADNSHKLGQMLKSYAEEMNKSRYAALGVDIRAEWKELGTGFEIITRMSNFSRLVQLLIEEFQKRKIEPKAQ